MILEHKKTFQWTKLSQIRKNWKDKIFQNFRKIRKWRLKRFFYPAKAPEWIENTRNRQKSIGKPEKLHFLFSSVICRKCRNVVQEIPLSSQKPSVLVEKVPSWQEVIILKFQFLQASKKIFRVLLGLCSPRLYNSSPALLFEALFNNVHVSSPVSNKIVSDNAHTLSKFHIFWVICREDVENRKLRKISCF